jgi:hypothetical protein
LGAAVRREQRLDDLFQVDCGHMVHDVDTGAPATPFVPLASRARWAVGALVATAIADLVAVVLDWRRIDLLDRMGGGGDVTLSEADASDRLQLVIAIVQLSLIAVTAFLFIRWFWRAYLNVEALGAARRFGTGWAIGSWFVPVLSVWRPKQIANDLWYTSNVRDPTESSPSGRSSPLLTWWWLAFLVSTGITAGPSGSGSTIHDLRRETVVDLVADTFDIVAAGLAVAVVLLLTARQAERARRRAELT